MGTRCYVGIKNKDKVEYIYIHWDGYIDRGVGEELLKNYNTPAKARKLIALGNLSTLVEITESYKNMGRGPEQYLGYVASIDNFVKSAEDMSYAYLMIDGFWIVHSHHGWEFLADAIELAGKKII